MADDAQSVPTPDEPAPAETVPTPATTVTESVAPAEPTPEVVPEVSQSAGQATKSADSPVDDTFIGGTPETAVPPISESASPEPQPVAPIPVSPSPQQPSAEQIVQATQSKRWSDADRARAVATRARKYEARLAKIVEYARTHGRVANDSIVKLLRVSDATASRYAKMLAARGVLAQEGKGRGAHYNFKP